MVAPAAVPEGIVARLSETAAGAVRAGALHQRLIEIGYVPVGSSPAEFRARIDERGRQVDADHPDSQYQAHLNNREKRERNR